MALRCLLAVVVALGKAHASPSDVRINEVSPTSDSGGVAWVELYHAGDEDVNVAGWRLVGSSEEETFVLGTPLCQQSTVLRPRQHMVVQQQSQEIPTGCGFQFGFDPRGGRVVLLDAAGRNMDTAEWDISLEDGSTWGRQPDGSGDFRKVDQPTPGEANPDPPAVQTNEPTYGTGQVCEFSSLNVESFNVPEVAAEVSNALRLDEMSGLAPSIVTPGVLWVHEDDDDAILYALSSSFPFPGRLVGEIALDVKAEDLEDIATAKCPDGLTDCIWVADTGDNCARDTISETYRGRRAPDCSLRRSSVVWAIQEPQLHLKTARPMLFDASLEDDDRKMWAFQFTLEGGEKLDFESLLVKPDGSQFFLIERTRLCCPAVFASPSVTASAPGTVLPMELSLIAELSNPPDAQLSGADFHPNGMEFIASTPREGVYVYRLQRPFDLSTAGLPLFVTWVPAAPQLEGIAYVRPFEDRPPGLWMASESDVRRVSPPLTFLACPDG